MKANTQQFQTFDYTLDDETVQEIVSKFTNRNPSVDKLPALRKPFKIDSSLIQAAEYEAKVWLERRIPAQQVKHQTLEDLLRALFSALSVDENGKVNGLRIVEQLISLGLASEPASLIKILCAAFKEPNINKLTLSLHDMMLFCSGDRRTDYILEKLNFYAENYRSPSPILHSNLILPNAPSIFARPISMEPPKRKHAISHTARTQSVTKKKNLTMADHLNIVNEWWKEIDNKNEGFVDSEEVAIKLIEKRIVANSLEAKKLVGPGESKTGKANYQQFQQIFARSMLKGSLLSLADRLSEGPLAKPFFTAAMKLSAYKRKLLIARIKPNEANITQEEGENALKAIEKYKRYVRSISPTK
ncbi:unnamed protein product [Blepharisma stoltei]|uniref:EF-hand domain-containing protein n=1 Tax=Blepharisma stoltei TaxID=1481888 RepID=A0AAU9J651_9CILI|nr:unnamed protein product [Blepharisma stoltei]